MKMIPMPANGFTLLMVLQFQALSMDISTEDKRPKTENVQKAIIKRLDNFGKKIEKEAKKLFDFNHKFCVINFSFTEDVVPYHSVDFSSAGTRLLVQIVEAT